MMESLFCALIIGISQTFFRNYLEKSNEYATFVPSLIMRRLMKTAELKRLLKQHGCSELATTVRGHDIWINSKGVKFRVPRHQSKEIPTGTLRSILKQAGI